MRVALVSEHASPLAALGGVDAGGQNTHVAALAAALAARGHDVRVYTRRDAPDLPPRVACGPRVTVVHVPAGPARGVPKDDLLPYMGAFGRELADSWRAGDWAPDVVHAHFWMSGLAALTATARRRVPVVQTYHALGTVKRRYQGGADTSPRRRVAFERLLGLRTDRVVAQCTDEVEELVAMGVPRSRISVIPSGVDSDLFTPDGPAAPETPGRCRILSAGRLVERKGHADLIDALPAVPGAEVVIAGGPDAGLLDTDPLARDLVRRARRLGVADRVLLTGGLPADRMPEWYRSADVVACPAWYEPFGLTPLEAMACGIPVVAYAVGGFTDTVVDGITGDLVRPRDVPELAAALRRLLNDPVRRLAYGTAGLGRARDRYSWSRTAAQLEALYLDLISSTPDLASGADTKAVTSA